MHKLKLYNLMKKLYSELYMQENMHHIMESHPFMSPARATDIAPQTFKEEEPPEKTTVNGEQNKSPEDVRVHQGQNIDIDLKER